MKGDVLHESAKAFVLGHEIGFAIHLDKNADFALEMNVGGDDTFLGGARRFFARARDAFGAQERFGFVEIASRIGQGALAIHESGVRFFAKLFDELRIDFHGKI